METYIVTNVYEKKDMFSTYFCKFAKNIVNKNCFGLFSVLSQMISKPESVLLYLAEQNEIHKKPLLNGL